MITETLFKKALERAFRTLPDHPFAVRLHGGRTIAHPGGAPLFTVTVSSPAFLGKLLRAPGWSTLGEAYMSGDIDVEGDILQVYAVAEAFQAMFGDEHDASSRAELEAFRLEAAEATHTPDRDAEAISHHYDQGNRLFELVTDPTMGYSGACFYSHEDSIEQAQRNKLERAAGKIDVKPQDRVLDIGCGWGGLMSYVAGTLGANITGVTISAEQAKYTTERMAREGLADQTAVHLCDYRDIAEEPPFDKIISLGMVEHVGVAKLPTYFQKTFDLLRPGGLFLLQGLSSRVTEERAEVIDFASEYLFPDASMPYLVDYLNAIQAAGFEVRDVENLREHYGWTHIRWLRNLEANKDAVIEEIGETRFRAMRIMFSYSATYLLAGNCSLFQFVLWKPDGAVRPDLPLRRRF